MAETVGGLGHQYQEEIKKVDVHGKRITLGYFKDKKDRWIRVATATLNILAGATIPSFLLVFAFLVDELTIKGQTRFSWSKWIWIMVFIGVADIVIVYGGTSLAEISAERQLYALRKRFLHEVMRQDIEFFDRHDATTLSSRLTRNAQTVRDLVGIRAVVAYTYIGLIIASIAVAFWQCAEQAGVSLAVVPFLIGSGWWATRTESRAKQKEMQSDHLSSSIALEAFTSIKTVKAYDLQRVVSERFKKAVDEGYRQSWIAGMETACFYGLFWGLIFVGSAFGFWYGSRMLISRERDNCIEKECPTTGQLVVSFITIVMAAYFIGKLIPWYAGRRLAVLAVRETVSMYDRKSKIDPFSEEGSHEPFEGDLKFEGVKFAYPSRPTNIVFNNLVMHIPQGKTTALVGGSGCGKSTVVEMVLRFYDPQEGTVTLDGRPISSYNIKWLRDNIAWVPQEPKLFATSVAENIKIGNPTATDDEVQRAATEANAHDFIRSFPDGYNTFVGEGGCQLSGGQKQRIVIARAILRNPKILILDEATSALDNKSERTVQATLDQLLMEKRRTTIIIAHRLTTIRNADKIIVLGEGPDQNGTLVVEEGTHTQLLDKPDGLYAALVRMQVAAQVDGQAEASIELFNKSAARSSEFKSSISKHSTDLERQESKTIIRTYSKAVVKAVAPSNIFWRSFKPVRSEWYSYLAAIVGAIGYGILWPLYGVLSGGFMRVFADYTLTPDQKEVIAHDSTVTMAVVGISAWAAYFLWMGLGNRTGQKLVKEFKCKTYDQVLRQEIAYFDEPQHAPGMLQETVCSSPHAVKGWVNDTPILYLLGLGTIIFGLVMVNVTEPRVGKPAIGMTFVLIPCSWFGAAIARSGGKFPWKSKSQDKYEESMEAIITDVVLNVRQVAAYNLQGRMEDQFREVVRKQFIRGLFKAQLSGIFCGIADGLRLLTCVLVIYLSAKISATETAAGLELNLFKGGSAFVLACFQVGRSLTSMFSGADGRGAAKKILTVVDREPEIVDDDEEGVHIDSLDEVEFDHTWFHYPSRPDQLVYRDISFKVPRGHTVALVGASGCGKSTAVQLIERFYDVSNGGEGGPYTGPLKINGINIRECNVRALRRRIGLVSQEPVLFWGTIEENIAYGRPDASLEDIVEACRESNAWGFVEAQEDKLQTDVGRGGSKLSGGQKQRIALARALIRRPDLLILDEATSALDAESEKVVQEALSKLLHSRAFTTIIIAHRLSTIRNADTIVVFQPGGVHGSKIVEIGSHEELIQIPNGIYRSLVRVAVQ